MIVVLSNNKYMYKTVLPEKIAGRYWLKDEINGKVRNLVCVEASDNRWIAKSNRYARFYGYDNESIKEELLKMSSRQQRKMPKIKNILNR